MSGEQIQVIPSVIDISNEFSNNYSRDFLQTRAASILPSITKKSPKHVGMCRLLESNYRVLQGLAYRTCPILST